MESPDPFAVSSDEDEDPFAVPRINQGQTWDDLFRLWMNPTRWGLSFPPVLTEQQRQYLIHNYLAGDLHATKWAYQNGLVERDEIHFIVQEFTDEIVAHPSVQSSRAQVEAYVWNTVTTPDNRLREQ